jgi:phosphoribosyl isomerase A
VPIGVEGAIAGTALYTGSLSLAEALEVTKGAVR